MRTDLKRIKLLFKSKTQPANSSSCRGGDEWHNTEVNGRMYSAETEIADLVEKHLQTGTKLGGPAGAMGPLNSKKKKKNLLAPTNKFFWPLAPTHKSFWLRPYLQTQKKKTRMRGGG
jgi:hypothetical protein